MKRPTFEEMKKKALWDPAVKAEYDSLTTHNDFMASLFRKRRKAIEDRAAEILSQEKIFRKTKKNQEHPTKTN